MKNTIITFFMLLLCAQLQAQTYKIAYQRSYNDKVAEKDDPLLVFTNAQQTVISSLNATQSTAPYPFETFFVDRSRNDLYYKVTAFSATKELATADSTILKRYTLTPTPETKTILGYRCKKATTSVNSNSIELWYTNDLGVKGAPNELGQDLGVVLEYVRNGNSKITATAIEKIKSIPQHVALRPFEKIVDGPTYQDELWKSRFIQIPIFTDEQINFSDKAKSDSILRFANGTVIVKKVKIPKLSPGQQAFVQLVEKSNGDAYDRTGSVFMVAEDQAQSFLDGMNNGMKTLPMYNNGDGQDYPGMVRTQGFSPLYELMRFFTPFGVSHFNDRLKLKDKAWQDSALYRQDISEFLSVMGGREVYIGTYIGNYDQGGHRVSLEITIHPGSSQMTYQQVMPIFNSTNVMEMGGQTYARFFSQEKGLEVSFELPQDAKGVQLRYISTGHGGWGNGDEFVPKENNIYLDGKLAFQFTPWRNDCGSYRLYNPVSGNFQNGLSSSDLSRSNWCPGAVTTPMYINLGDLKAGKHSVRVHIPQGQPEGSSFSFWNVSGVLLYR